MIAKDFFGNEIKIGDTVAFMQKGYRSLLTGVVANITAQTVLISHKHPQYPEGYVETTKQFHSQVIKKCEVK